MVTAQSHRFAHRSRQISIFRCAVDPNSSTLSPAVSTQLIAQLPRRNPHHAEVKRRRRGDPNAEYHARKIQAARRVPSSSSNAASEGDPRRRRAAGISGRGGHLDYPQVLVVPLNRRPLMPGVIMPVRVMDERLIQEIEEMKARGQAYVGTFLKRTEGESENVDPSDDMHDIGTFAQVQSVIRIPDISADTLKDEDDKASSGTTRWTSRPRRRLGSGRQRARMAAARTALFEHRFEDGDGATQPRWCRWTTSRSEVADRDDDDVLKAGERGHCHDQNLLKVNPPQRGPILCASSRISRTPTAIRRVDAARRRRASGDSGHPRRPRAPQAATASEKRLSCAAWTSAGVEKDPGDQRRYFLMEQLKSIKKELGMERDDKTALQEKFRRSSRRSDGRRARREDNRRGVEQPLIGAAVVGI